MHRELTIENMIFLNSSISPQLSARKNNEEEFVDEYEAAKHDHPLNGCFSILVGLVVVVGLRIFCFGGNSTAYRYDSQDLNVVSEEIYQWFINNDIAVVYENLS